MHVGRLYADGEEYAQDFDSEYNDDAAHYVCAHNIGICLDEILEPMEYIGTVIWPDGIESDDFHEIAAIQFWNSGY